MDIFGKALGIVKNDGGGDFVDRLSYQYTVSMLIVSATVMSAKQYVGQPIQCWVPAQFTKAMEQYTENYCWIQNTYWVSWKSSIPDDQRERVKSQISYYQWVPFILLGQASLFYIPSLFWKLMRNISDPNDYLFGLKLLTNLIYGSDWQSSGVFPRTTLCDFDVRVLGNLHRYTVQCVLMINMFNEKLFIFIWFWLSLVTSVILVDLAYSSWSLLVPYARKIYVRSLILDDRFQKVPYPSHIFKSFVEKTLCANGVLMLKLIEGHVGVVTASHVTIEMWYNFLNRYQHVDARRQKSQMNGGEEIYEDEAHRLFKRANSARFGFAGTTELKTV